MAMEEGLSSLMDDNMIRAVSILIAAVVVFFVHELGHYVVARLCDVRVDNVTIGFGREVWRRTDTRGTLWSVRIYPFCGFVHLAQKTDQDENRKGVFCYQTVGKRFAVIAAGPLANLFLAWVILSAFFMGVGEPSIPPYVTGVEIGSPADKAGFKPGDKIVAFNGRAIVRFDDVWPVTQKVIDVPLPFTLERNGKIIETTAISQWSEYKDSKGFKRAHGRIGAMGQHQPLLLTAITSVAGQDAKGKEDRARALLLQNMDRDVIVGMKSEDGKSHDSLVNIPASANPGLRDSKAEDFDKVYFGQIKDNFYLRRDRVASMAAALDQTGRLITGVASVAGRIGGADRSLVKPDVKVSRNAAPLDFYLYNLVWLTAVLSICIALLNCMPVPGFDGAYMLLCLLEAALGVKRAEIVRPYAIRIAMLALVWAMMVINLDTLNLLFKPTP